MGGIEVQITGVVETVVVIAVVVQVIAGGG